MSNEFIEVENLSLSLNGKAILKDVSFSVGEGEYISIVGPNGAGKSTLLKCMIRIHRKPSGVIRIAGRRLSEYRQRTLAQRVSYVPQADAAVSPYTVHEFVMMGRYPYLHPFSAPGPEDRDAVRNALDATGTMEFRERLLGALSGGERRKVSIAAALAQRAHILLLDEPTAFLDPRHEADINRLLARVHRDRGVAVVSVTHDINRAVLTSRRVLALKDGAVAFCGPADEFMNNEVLDRIYDKTFTLMEHPRHGGRLVAPEVPE